VYRGALFPHRSVRHVLADNLLQGGITGIVDASAPRPSADPPDARPDPSTSVAELAATGSWPCREARSAENLALVGVTSSPGHPRRGARDQAQRPGELEITDAVQ